MSLYFKEKQEQKILLSDYIFRFEEEYKQLERELEKYAESLSSDACERLSELKAKQEKLKSKYFQVKHIYSCLGDVIISEELIDTLCESMKPSMCRYKLKCVRKDSIRGLYDISIKYPELSKQAILEIGHEYIKDLFDEYFILDLLAEILEIEQTDEAFTYFMSEVRRYADILEEKYTAESRQLSKYCDGYSSQFIRYFERFIIDHHISCDKFVSSLPSKEIISSDESKLAEIIRGTRESWCGMVCYPVSYEMFKDYLDGDLEISEYDEQPSYYVSKLDKTVPATFTKTKFLRSIKIKGFVKKK